jgi:DNA-binding transcriptional LysR family regulator
MANLRHLDFSMLMAFEHLMRERSVSRAAERMYVTQSAMSHTLQRLREQLGDPLLVRTPSGMKPTQRAEEIVGPVRAMLRDAEQLLASTAEFEPWTSHQRFEVAGSDYIEFLILPRLIARLRRLAPGIEIRVSRADSGSLEERLANTGLDLVLGFRAMLKLPKYLAIRRLFDDTVVCIARADDPDTGREISVDEYLRRSQLLISSCDLNAVLVERWLEYHGLERRVALVVPNFLSAPFTVATTDLLLSLPRRIAEACKAFAAVKILPVPFDLPAYELVMAWHPVKEKDPGHAWLRAQIREVGAEIEGVARVPAAPGNLSVDCAEPQLQADEA